MATDQVITAKDIMDAVIRIRRIGVEKSLQELEQREPDLAEIVLEELSAVHRRLQDAGMPARRTRRLMRRIESLVLVAIAAMRQGHLRLWEEPADAGAATDAAESGPASGEQDHL